MKKIKQIGIPLLIISFLVIVSIILSKVFTMGFAKTSAALKKMIGGQTVFLLSVGEFDDSKSADEMSTRISNLGAAGFIVIDGSKYNVISSMYTNEKDANKVLESLKVQFNSANIIKRQIAKVNLNDAVIAEQINSCLTKIINFYIESFIKLDKNETTPNKIKLNSLLVNAEIDNLIEKLEQSANEIYVKIKMLFKQLKNELQLISSVVEEKSSFKYLGIQTFINIENFFASL